MLNYKQIRELKFTNSDRIGQGGNGLVYSAKINEKDIAIKFLISDSERKLSRFKSEYFNTNYVRNELHNVVNMIHYDEIVILETNRASVGKEDSEDNLMRVCSKEIAEELLELTFGEEKYQGENL